MTPMNIRHGKNRVCRWQLACAVVTTNDTVRKALLNYLENFQRKTGQNQHLQDLPWVHDKVARAVHGRARALEADRNGQPLGDM